jgi:hypothetical protein
MEEVGCSPGFRHLFATSSGLIEVFTEHQQIVDFGLDFFFRLLAGFALAFRAVRG